MAIIDTSIEALSRRITAGLEKDLATALKKKLMEEAERIVEEAALEIAHILQVRIQTYRDVAGGTLQVSLVLDGVSTLVPPQET